MLAQDSTKKETHLPLHKHIMWQLTPCPHIKMSCHVCTSNVLGSSFHGNARHFKKGQTTSTTQHVMWQFTPWPHIKNELPCNTVKYVQISQVSMAKRKLSL